MCTEHVIVLQQSSLQHFELPLRLQHTVFSSVVTTCQHWSYSENTEHISSMWQWQWHGLNSVCIHRVCLVVYQLLFFCSGTFIENSKCTCYTWRGIAEDLKEWSVQFEFSRMSNSGELDQPIPNGMPAPNGTYSKPAHTPNRDSLRSDTASWSEQPWTLCSERLLP